MSTQISQLVSTDKREFISTDTTGINCYDNDKLFEILSDLVNPQFRAWYCKRFYALGKDEVLKRASIARADGKDKRKYFSVLLKK